MRDNFLGKEELRISRIKPHTETPLEQQRKEKIKKIKVALVQNLEKIRR